MLQSLTAVGSIAYNGGMSVTITVQTVEEVQLTIFHPLTHILALHVKQTIYGAAGMNYINIQLMLLHL